MLLFGGEGHIKKRPKKEESFTQGTKQTLNSGQNLILPAGILEPN
jgi:hypothetical protein